MREKVRRGAAAEFLKFFCQLARDAKLPLWHDLDASLKRSYEPIRRFEEDEVHSLSTAAYNSRSRWPLFTGRNPRNENFSVENPDPSKAVRIAEGPGMIVNGSSAFDACANES